MTTEDPDFRGVWDSVLEYVQEQISEYLPPGFSWLVTACDPDKLVEGYTAGRIVLETKPHGGRVAIFERSI